MIQTQIVWIRHIMTKADMVIWSIHDVFEDIHPPRNEEERCMFPILIKNRMREIVKFHQSVYR